MQLLFNFETKLNVLLTFLKHLCINIEYFFWSSGRLACVCVKRSLMILLLYMKNYHLSGLIGLLTMMTFPESLGPVLQKKHVAL
jgi:hypothetical protein